MKNLKQRQHQEDPENGMGLASVFRVQNSNRLNEKSQAYGVDVLSLEMHDWYGSGKDHSRAKGA